MKTIHKLKLNQLDKKELENKEQLEIRGGCDLEACYYWCKKFPDEGMDAVSYYEIMVAYY